MFSASARTTETRRGAAAEAAERREARAGRATERREKAMVEKRVGGGRGEEDERKKKL